MQLKGINISEKKQLLRIEEQGNNIREYFKSKFQKAEEHKEAYRKVQERITMRLAKVF